MRPIDADAFKEYIKDGIDGLILPKDQAVKVIAVTKSFLKDIDEQPTVEIPQIEWIPCSERLPENINLVLVTWENTNPESYYKSIKGKKFCGAGHYCNGKWFWESNTCQDYLAEYGRCGQDEMDEAIKVIAWMPLPEPYREEARE